MMKKISFVVIISFAYQISLAQTLSNYNLSFDKLANRWDEGMPLGNGMLGALIWGKGDKLRLSLDRADLWDERKALPDLTTYSFKWVQQQVEKKEYRIVQKTLDEPYHETTPTKIPAAAIEFDVSSFGKVLSNVLDINTALNTVKFQNGIVFNCYIHATKNQGFFGFENLVNVDVLPNLIVHNYAGNEKIAGDNSHAGQGLQKLGYAKGDVIKTQNSIRYKQPMTDGHFYEVLITWQKIKNKIIGSWTVTKDTEAVIAPISTTAKEPTGWDTHIKWWTNYWSKSSISIPDDLVQKQYYLEMYKLGSAARKGAPAITLQAVWTADNGSLPPWKGDFHNDLNTQLSYWPTYTSNHLAEGKTFTDWLWKVKEESEIYTKNYFGVPGLNIPGVVALSGKPMGGWVQYSMSPTVSAWCSQHFYWQWKYSMDEKFLKEQAYPYITQSATFLENITFLKDGVRMLPLSSSPEYNDNDISAWFKKWSNFDLSLAKFLFKAAKEVSIAKGDEKGAKHWAVIASQLPDYEVNETGFTIAPGQNLVSSHRHMSQYMGIYPLALLDYNKTEDKVRIDNSFKQIEAKGTRAWVGYSFSWMASLYARAYQADKAIKQLQIFASNFCSPNSFHLNGDQKGGQYSGFTYRPFTLEGNFAFAQGVHELLLQSRDGYIEVFPAVPSTWNECSFKDLRAEGAFLISANYKDGMIIRMEILSENGGVLNIKLPEGNFALLSRPNLTIRERARVLTQKGERLVFVNKG
ncbi:glycosyl hydrolase family 95 catalytic domain-containing protein [Pedobacter frigiditerrae]|uniref:glycosyl hydrolase family 95 catalytic domain-containing protein n=1 Tax=Pedobacter frigiditerrae TaxID=2530452 RepID=UPI0029301F7E|nr:glycoside hydrolase N-terminal domain-containing protein [Pedobacter frigiditerrae]